jgi:D-alanine-D-alanine ligase
MSPTRRTSVAVLYNFVGEDEYETLRVRIRNGDVVSPTGDLKDLESISTVREDIDAIVAALRDEGYAARAVNIRDDFDRLFSALTSPRPDVVFNLVEFFNNSPRQEDRVAALYDLLRIPYTGSPPMTLAICQRKGLTKQVLRGLRIPIPRYVLVREEPFPPKPSGLVYPLIVKPAWEDASTGVDELAVVEDRAQLERRVHMILSEHRQPALVEEFIAGRELGVSVLGNANPVVLPIEEVDFSNLPPQYRGILSFESKWDPLHEVFHLGKLVCPAEVAEPVRSKVEEIALRTYRALGCRDYARIDMRLDKDDRLFVLEVNPNPDLTEGVAFMASAEAAGMSFAGTLKTIVEEALKRVEPPSGGGETARPDGRETA